MLPLVLGNSTYWAMALVGEEGHQCCPLCWEIAHIGPYISLVGEEGHIVG